MSETIILIDAYAQIYRGFYALPPMNNSKGIFTNAIFAFSRFLLNLEKAYSPNRGAIVYDLGKSKARIEIAPDYKANRPPMPEELRSQIPYIRKITELFGYPLLESEGIEADDLIAGIAKKFTEFKVNIISADKDLAQVIDERIEMLIPGKRGGGFDKRGVQEVIEKFDVTPDQIIDYLSLIGDSSDNIPGIQGVGPKTAAKLLHQFGSIDQMLEKIPEIKNEKLRNKIYDGKERLIKNKKLITLNTNLPTDWNIDTIISKKSPNWQEIKELAEELELKSFLKDVNEFYKEPEPEKEIVMETGDLFQFFE